MLEACIQKQATLINDFEKRLAFVKNNEVIGNDSYDQKDLAMKSQQDEEQTLLSEQLQFAEDEMSTLQLLQSDLKKLHHEVNLGAVVVTGHRTFYICASIEAFQVNGNHYIGLSVKSPLFQAMKGKKEGDAFTWKQETYTISTIF